MPFASPPRLFRALALLPITATLLLSACRQSPYSYPLTADKVMFFRVPSSWHEFPTEQTLSAEHLKSPGAGAEYKWDEGYDADPNHPSLDHVFNPLTRYPSIHAYQKDLDPGDRYQISLAGMTNLEWPVDEGLNSGTVKLVGPPNEELSFPGGYHGNRIVFDIIVRAGGLGVTGVIRIDQTVAIDWSAHHVYFFQVACSVECFTQNQSLINDIVQSLTLKERSS